MLTQVWKMHPLHSSSRLQKLGQILAPAVSGAAAGLAEVDEAKAATTTRTIAEETRIVYYQTRPISNSVRNYHLKNRQRPYRTDMEAETRLTIQKKKSCRADQPLQKLGQISALAVSGAAAGLAEVDEAKAATMARTATEETRIIESLRGRAFNRWAYQQCQRTASQGPSVVWCNTGQGAFV
ncbi:hypothetical protein EDD22DRAFT_1051638 [Suillus occidentalis]|nr:hypothetical protein EDD22DRAFT_1051638 [Suillus occidentalis]